MPFPCTRFATNLVWYTGGSPLVNPKSSRDFNPLPPPPFFTIVIVSIIHRQSDFSVVMAFYVRGMHDDRCFNEYNVNRDGSTESWKIGFSKSDCDVISYFLCLAERSDGKWNRRGNSAPAFVEDDNQTIISDMMVPRAKCDGVTARRRVEGFGLSDLNNDRADSLIACIRIM